VVKEPAKISNETRRAMEQTSIPVRKIFLPRFFRATAKKVNLNMAPLSHGGVR
jgi:hypothetical protein